MVPRYPAGPSCRPQQRRFLKPVAQVFRSMPVGICRQRPSTCLTPSGVPPT